MKSGGIRSVLCAALIACLSPSASLALDLYYNNVDAGLPGPNLTPDGVWAWTSGPDAVFTQEVTEFDGVGGTQSFRQTTDASGAFGTSWYFSRGFGHFAVWADEGSPLAGGVDGSNDPARYRFSMDVNVSGNNGTTPLAFGISATDMNYEATHNIDVNGDGDFDDGAELYNHYDIKPTISVSGQWVNISFTFDEGTAATLDPDIPLQDQVFSNGLALQWSASYGSGEFGLDAGNGDHNEDGTIDAADYVAWRKRPDSYGGDAGGYNTWFANFGMPGSGNVVNMDNFRIEFLDVAESGGGSAPVPEPATWSIAALLAFGCWISTRRLWGTNR